MAENSAISWTDHTFNPWIGCQKVSPGCLNCYAETLMDRRYKKAKWGPNGTRVITSETNWRQPLKWNRHAEEAGERRRVFCASLADVFEDRPELIEPRRRLLDLIYQTPHLDWLLLTKRPENIIPMIGGESGAIFSEFCEDGLFSNLWLGTSVENQAEANRRIPHLLRTPAAVRFISAEPLLGPVDLRGKLIEWRRDGSSYFSPVPFSTCHRLIDWVIVGGESGHNARPMHPDWARSLRDQCQDANVAFHFKQWGEWAPWTRQSHREASPHDLIWIDQAGGTYGLEQSDSVPIRRVGKNAAGRSLDGREWDEFPEPIRIGTKAGSA